MAVRENGFGPVKSWIMTPAQREEHERRVREKAEGTLIKKWERSMTKEQYLEAVAEGRSREDIVLKHFNNDLQELRKQLREWGVKPNGEGTGEMAQGVKSELTITKEQYLHRRLNGEKRMQIIRSLGVAAPRVYELLSKWGIRELDAEERALELLAPVKPVSEVGKRVAEQLEKQAEARAASEQEKAGVVNHQSIEQVAEEQKIANLEAAVAIWKYSAQQKDAEIANLQVELHKANAAADKREEEICAAIDNRGIDLARHKRLAEKLEATETELEQFKSERQLLLQTIEQAACQDAGIITIRLPILPVAIAHIERARIYESVEALSNGVEAADIDRERVMSELFDLLQRVVNFVTADLAELHPGKDVTGFVMEFFDFYNGCHLDVTTNIRAAG